MIGLLVRILLATAVIAAGLIVGAEMRTARDELARGQAAASSRASATPFIPATVPPTPIATASKPLPVPTPAPTPMPALRTVVPTPVATPFTGVLAHVAGRVTAGGKPVRGAQIMVYPSNAFNHGPTPVPPETAKTMTDDKGAYDVGVPPGTYRIGAFRYEATTVADEFATITWYGDGYAIGFGKDLVVTGDVPSADIPMLPMVTVAGRVVGRDGIGVPNAQLMLYRYSGGIQFPLVALGTPTSDPTGAFSLSIAAMPLTLQVQASGKTDAAWTAIDLDLRGDRTDIVATIDRGNAVSGTLRDASGKPLANVDFGVTLSSGQASCAYSCNARTDGAGRFSITVPSATLRFRNWAQPGGPDLLSAEYVIAGDTALDPVLSAAR